jgi:hypothetical protein
VTEVIAGALRILDPPSKNGSDRRQNETHGGGDHTNDAPF